jgi:UDP-N-acetylglucosamine acyltransferase
MKNVFIHPTAVVETEDIGTGTYIGPFTYISKRVEIGRNCKIYGASIGLPGEHPNGADDKGGIVVIGDNVEIREYVTISCPLFTDRTLISNGCYLMAKSHVGHDVTLHERVVLHTSAIIGGHSEIGKYCYMGLNCSTHPFAKLGAYCIVGANSFYKGNSPSALVWAGVPARAIKVNKIGLERHASDNEKSIYEEIAKDYLVSPADFK